MTTLLGIDIGSSSFIFGILKVKTVLNESPRTFFKDKRVEVASESILKAVTDATMRSLGTLVPRER